MTTATAARRRDLAALVGSRICHDLISPLGAIGNGVELLGLEGTEASPELEMIADSVAAANARVRFFRVAYGEAGEEAVVPFGEITGILADMTRAGRLSISWEATEDAPRRLVRLVFLLLQCIESALPRGGRISVTSSGERWSLSAEAPRVAVADPLWRLVTAPGGDMPIRPGEVHFALAGDVARDLGRTVSLEAGQTAIRVRL